MSYKTPFDKQSANLVSRFFALMIDGLILLVPSFLIMLPGFYLGLLSSGGPIEQTFYIQLSSAIVSILTSFYRPIFFALKGKTPGMRAMGLKIVTNEGHLPSLGESIKREFPNLLQAWISSLVILLTVFLYEFETNGKALFLSLLHWASTIIWVINTLFIIFTMNHTSLGDRWAKTIIVESRGQGPKDEQSF